MIHERPIFYEFDENLFLVVTIWITNKFLKSFHYGYPDELLIYPPLVTHCSLFIHGRTKRHQITIKTKKNIESTKLRKKAKWAGLKKLHDREQKTVSVQEVDIYHCLPRKQKRHQERISRTAKMFSRSRINGNNYLS